MKVVIAEKPSVAMDLGKALGNVKRHDGYLMAGGYCITWAIGHLVEFNDAEIAPKAWQLNTLPILPEQFQYQVTPDKLKQFNIIQDLLKNKNTEGVVIATDAGREGELIARLILKLADYRGPIERFWTSEALSEEVVQREFSRLKNGHDFDSLYFSALGRQQADWIFGINLTRLATIQATDRSVWSVGRVQTPVLKLLVERELEIRNFKPEPYWVIKAEFTKENQHFSGTLQNKAEKNSAAFFDQDKIQAILAELEEASSGIIAKVKQEEKKQKPPLLHSLTTLQKEANQIYSYPAKQTLDLAQELYEAKKISYPRTDAQYLDEQKDTKDLVKRVLGKLGKANLAERVDKVGKSVFNTKKLTDHYAVIPQDLMTKKDIGQKLTEAHYNIYILIARRLTGAFMPDYIYQTTAVTTKVNISATLNNHSHLFLSRGRVDVQLGWKELYKRDKTTPEGEEKEEEQALPPLTPEDEVEKEGQKLESKQTRPAERYKESSVLGVMERLNLGTPATRASIIETLKTRKYMALEKKNLIPLDKGIQLIQSLGERTFTNPEMTANWEEQLEEIYKRKLGRQGYQEFLARMKGFVQEEVENLKSLTLVGSPEGGPDQALPTKCEACKTITELDKCFKCSTCSSVVWKDFMNKTLTLKQATGLLGGKTIAFKGLKSKQGRVFDAKAHFAEGKIQLTFADEQRVVGKCACEGDISENPRSFTCQKCGSIIWKDFMEKTLVAEQAVSLLGGKEVAFEGLKSKQGNIFSATAHFAEGKIQLVFDEEQKGLKIGTCQCKGEIMELPRTFKCSTCSSVIWKDFMNKTLTAKQATGLLGGKTIAFTGLKSKQGRIFAAKAHFAEGKIQLTFDEEQDGPTIGKCDCEGDIIELSRTFKCQKCGRFVWKQLLEKTLTTEEAQALLDGKTISLTGLKSRAGKVFSAKGTLAAEGKVQLLFG